GRLSDPSYQVRASAAWALGALRSRAAVPPLIKAIDDKEGYVGGQAVHALGWIGDRRASNKLIKLVSTRHDLANEACRALGAIKEERAISVLVNVLGIDHSHCFATEGIGALALGDNAADALAHIGKPAAAALIKSLTNPDAFVRERSAIALTTIKD